MLPLKKSELLNTENIRKCEEKEGKTEKIDKSLGLNRREQRKNLEADFSRLASAFMERDSSRPEGTIVKLDVISSRIVDLSAEMCENYRKYPLLCERGNKLELEEGKSPESSVPPRKKKKRPKKHQEGAMKKRMRFLKRNKGKSSSEDKKLHLNGSECRRCLAVAYNKTTSRIGYGLSGQQRKVKIHPSIWGKSLVSGRPRGTCAEFRVINEALTCGEKVEDLVMYVVDVISGEPKPRCRNCLFLSKDSLVLSDDLQFDGDVRKKKR
mmetsp:Transcript_21516/g.32016  ORF Transcript_21516/g.32016 Transcript_21516/m.32016 type:complete len:267 (+) Transcript_21516:116-916(+)